MTNHAEKLMDLVPSGDGYNSEYSDTLINAAEYIKSLEEDKTRLDWLADKRQSIGNVQLPTQCVTANLHSLRDAIDCAMEIE